MMFVLSGDVHLQNHKCEILLTLMIYVLQLLLCTWLAKWGERPPKAMK